MNAQPPPPDRVFRMGGAGYLVNVVCVPVLVFCLVAMSILGVLTGMDGPEFAAIRFVLALYGAFVCVRWVRLNPVRFAVTSTTI